MSQTSGSYIYTGPWINWSHGLIRGSTITLSERDAGLLTAFLAIFVSAAGVACWRIMSYIMHQYRATQEPQDGLHHQQQAIFRNTSSPGGASWQFVLLMWFWRKNATRSLLRNLPFVILALLNIALFGVAGIFSSEVTKAAGNETLVRSPNCGYLALSDDVTQESEAAFIALDLNDTLSASTYSRACYDGTENILQCNQFTKQRLPWTVKQNATCPFDPNLCYSGGTSAYQMDTGRLSSHEDLGINAPSWDRVQYRKVTTCSPIHSKGYASQHNDTDPADLAYGDLFEQYFYGPIVNLTNYTYQYNTHSQIDNNGYTLTSYYADAGEATDTWIPIPQLNRSDSDISLFLLAPNSVVYESPVTDPFFTATTPYSLPTGREGVNYSYYQPDFAVYPLACADQHQFCNPRNEKCTALTGYGLLQKDIPSLALNEEQLSTFYRLELLFEFLNTYGSVNSRGANALRASETVDESIQVPLPDGQWMKEVTLWFEVSLAKLQQKVVQYAAGPTYIPPGVKLNGPETKVERKMCRSQKVRSPSGTESFSVLGVAVILVVGILLVLTNLLLDVILGFARKKFGWKDYKRLQWILDEKLQLQRLAYEEAGQGQWSGGTDSVPITRYGDQFGMPYGVDATHPRLSVMGGQAGNFVNPTPEAEGLMNQKGMGYRVDEIGVDHTRY